MGVVLFLHRHSPAHCIAMHFVLLGVASQTYCITLLGGCCITMCNVQFAMGIQVWVVLFSQRQHSFMSSHCNAFCIAAWWVLHHKHSVGTSWPVTHPDYTHTCHLPYPFQLLEYQMVRVGVGGWCLHIVTQPDYTHTCHLPKPVSSSSSSSYCHLTS